MHTFDDILNRIGFGPWNWLVFLLSSSWGLLASLQALASAFLVPATEFECASPLVASNWTRHQIQEFSFPKVNGNFSKCSIYKRNFSQFSDLDFDEAMHIAPSHIPQTIQCSNWTYDTSVFQSTVVTEWNLVCDRQYAQPLVQSTFMLGFLVGAPIGGILADRFGRKRVICLGFYVCAVLSFLATFAPYFELFLILRFFMALSGYCVYQTSYILVVECSCLKVRGIVGLAFCIPFALGYMLLPCLAYFIRNWRYLHLTLSFLIIPLIGNTLLLPESPRWLMLNGKKAQAESEIKKAFKWNKREFLPQELQTVQQNGNVKIENESDVSNSICHIFSSPVLRKYCFILTFIWFTSSMVYYGVSLNSANLSADPFLYMFLGGLVELPCYTVVVPIVVRFGRRRSLSTLFYLGAITILGALCLPNGQPNWCLIALNLFAKLCISSAFQLIFLYSSEVFPTNVRTQGVGITNVIGRVGATASPFITGIGGYYHWSIPSVIFGISCLCSGLLIFQLPETNGKPLPDSTTDAYLLQASTRQTKADRDEDEISQSNNGPQKESSFEEEVL